MADQDVVKRLLATCTAKVSERALDDLVHDVKTGEASTINNEGWQSQITYLLDAGVAETDIAEAIEGDDD